MKVTNNEETNQFKDGDVIKHKFKKPNCCIAILKGEFINGEFSDYIAIDMIGELVKSNDKWKSDPPDWRLATEQEKQLLYSKMKKEGFKWNEEERRVENMRSRVNLGE